MTRRLLGSGLALLAVSACNLDNPGIEPPKGQIAYPWSVGLTRDPDTGNPTHLVVVNSNFDLRYNAGSVQTFDLEVLETLMKGDGGVDDCFVLSSRAAGPGSDGGTFPNNTIFPDAAPGADADASADAGDAGAEGQDDAGVVDAGEGDASAADDSGVADAGSDDAAVALAADTMDGGLEGDAGTMTASGEITIPPGQRYGSQRGILCDARDTFPNAPLGEPEALADRCCFDRDQLLEQTAKVGDQELPLLTSELRIDSYATGLSVAPLDAPRPNRLYITTRSKNRLIYIDATNGKLDCGGDRGTFESETNCTRGINEKSKSVLPAMDISFPSVPNDLTIGKLSELGLDEQALSQLNPQLSPQSLFIASVHEQGQTALMIDNGSSGPVLYDVLTGGAPLQNFVTKASARDVMVTEPADQVLETDLLYVTSSSRNAPGIARVGVRVRNFVENADQPGIPSLQLYTSTPIVLTGISAPTDLRSVQVDPDDPTHLAVLIRGAQQSVAFIQLDSQNPTGARTQNLFAVGTGPAKLTSASLGGRSFVFASCYAEGSIYIFDLQREAQLVQLDSEVLGLSGPFEMVVDETRNLMYVADYAASVVRVVDLSALVDPGAAPPRIVATLGALRFAERLR